MYSTHKINLFFAINFCPTASLRLILCAQCCCLLQILQGPNLSVVLQLSPDEVNEFHAQQSLSQHDEYTVGKKECKENIAVGGKGRGRWGKQQGSLHHTCTVVHKQYKPHTLGIIYLIDLFFFAKSCVPNGRIIYKICVSCFFCAQKKTLWN